MPILTICKRPPEVGRLRCGEKVDTGRKDASGNPIFRPAKLETWRLTSPNKTALADAAALWGGVVTPWEDQWQVKTNANGLPIMIAPVAPTQFFELWDRGGCQRRCDGRNAVVPDGKGGNKEVKCLCDPDKRDSGKKHDNQCKFHTRASFFLEDLRAFGVWRVESGGYYAATEFCPAVEILEAQARNGNYPRAILAIEKRSVKRQNEKGETETRNYIVPVLRIEQTLRDVLAGVQARPAIEATATPQRQIQASTPIVACTCGAEKHGLACTPSCARNGGSLELAS